MTSHLRITVTLYVVTVIWCPWLHAEGGCPDIYPSYCGNECSDDLPHCYQSCPFNSMSVDCKYRDAGDTGAVSYVNSQTKIPGPVKILPPSQYLTDIYLGSSCRTRLVNISWILPQSDTSKYLQGFELRLSTTDPLPNAGEKFQSSHGEIVENTVAVKIVYFNVSLKTDDTSNMTFFYDCAPLMKPNVTAYTIQITSLPASSDSAKSVTKLQFLVENMIPNYVIPPAKNSAEWLSVVKVYFNPSSASIGVCFSQAPPSYDITSYLIELVDERWGPMNIVKYNVTLQISDNWIPCHEFLKVCPSSYSVFVSAVNEGGCKCKNDNICAPHCAKSLVRGVDMNAAPSCIEDSPTTVTSSDLIYSSHSPPDLSSSSQDPILKESGDVGRKVAAGIGAGLGALLILVIVFILYKKKISKTVNFSGPKGDPPPTNPGSPIETRLPLLIVYSRDNEAHREVVCRFAAFLQAYCNCDVIIDEWDRYRTAISQLGLAQWLFKQLDKASHILVIHSAGARKRYEGRLSGVKYESKDDVLTDLFVPSVLNLQEQFLQSMKKKKVFEVFFPHTSHNDVIDYKLGGSGMSGKDGRKAYALMTRLDELFLNLHGLSKYNPCGKAYLNLLNAEQYASCTEGEYLKQAIDVAIAFHKENPNWFEMSHRTIIEGHKNDAIYLTNDNINNNTLTSNEEAHVNETQKINSKKLSEGFIENKHFNTAMNAVDSPVEQNTSSPRCDMKFYTPSGWENAETSYNHYGTESPISIENIDSGLESLRLQSSEVQQFELSDEMYYPSLRRPSSSFADLHTARITHRSSVNSSDESGYNFSPPDEMDDNSSIQSSQYRHFTSAMNDDASVYSQMSDLDVREMRPMSYDNARDLEVFRFPDKINETGRLGHLYADKERNLSESEGTSVTSDYGLGLQKLPSNRQNDTSAQNLNKETQVGSVRQPRQGDEELYCGDEIANETLKQHETEDMRKNRQYNYEAATNRLPININLQQIL